MKKKGQKAVDREGALKTIRTLLPERIANFVEMQMDLHSKLKRDQRYSQETKAFALSLYHISGKAYRLVSKLFYLPSKSSLLKWVSGLPRKPGLAEEALEVINKKVKTMNEVNRLCTISFDEILIKANLYYDSAIDEVVGLEDDEEHKGNLVASSALVFMVRGIVENWKQPVAYQLVNEACDSDKVSCYNHIITSSDL